MNFEFYIAKRLFSNKQNKNEFSRPIVSVAICGIAVGVAVMILSVAIITGFKQKISEKVVGFNSHFQIVNYDNNNSYETTAISKNQFWIDEVKSLKSVTSINKYIQKAGIAKQNDNIHGVVYKGIDSDYNWDFFREYMVVGDVLSISDTARNDNVLVSEIIANALELKVGDSFVAYFFQDPPRMRKFTVTGIYNTQLEELDQIFVFVDIKHLQKLYNWNSEQITGFEIKIRDFSKIAEYDELLNNIISNNFQEDGSLLKVNSINKEYPAIFNWLSLLDMNVQVLIILILIVAGFNMVSGLLVIILERVNMIGIMKSMGARNIVIEKVFLYFGGLLICKGLLWGNLTGIAICLIQHYTGIIGLNPSQYYLSEVPINLNIMYVLLLNIGVLAITILMMLLPVMIVSKIKPADSIRFN